MAASTPSRQDQLLPVSFQQDIPPVMWEAVFQDELGKVLIRPRMLADIKSFVRTWDKNLGEQGFVEEAQVMAQARVDAAVAKAAELGATCSTSSAE